MKTSGGKTRFRSERGAVAVMVVVLLTVFIGMAALAVDVGYMMTARNELQNAADAAALAAARKLGYFYECGTGTACVPMPYAQQLTFTVTRSDLVTVAQNVALSNKAAGMGIALNDGDVVIGNWDAATKTVTPTLTSPDAVTVTVRSDGTMTGNGPITTFFAKIWGTNSVDVKARATAALTGQSTAPVGGLPLPVAINLSWISTLPCNANITFHPSSAGVCGAWHAYDGSTYNTSASDKKGVAGELLDLAAGTYASPETIAGVTQYAFTNGNDDSLFTANPKDPLGRSDMQILFDAMKVKNDGILDADTDPMTWTTGVPVYDDTVVGCSPNQTQTIVAFSTITITAVAGPPTSTVYATVRCDEVRSGRGGGQNFGTKGTIPGLVDYWQPWLIN